MLGSDFFGSCSPGLAEFTVVGRHDFWIVYLGKIAPCRRGPSKERQLGLLMPVSPLFVDGQASTPKRLDIVGQSEVRIVTREALFASLFGISVRGGDSFNRPIRATIGSYESAVYDLVHEVNDRLDRNAFVVTMEDIQVSVINSKSVVVLLNFRHGCSFV